MGFGKAFAAFFFGVIALYYLAMPLLALLTPGMTAYGNSFHNSLGINAITNPIVFTILFIILIIALTIFSAITG